MNPAKSLDGNKAAVNCIALYLPQFHPVPENDEWWGKGFTEWTNVTKAIRFFRDHEQPHLPTELGFYDLRLSETRETQAELAKQFGISGFCYYHYWFNGRRILERPFTEVLASGKPDFPFCLCWANENWTRRWDGADQEILLEQIYTPEDDIAHIRSLIPAFLDRRYISVNGKPLFIVYRAEMLPDPRATSERWRREAERAGLPGLFLVRVENGKHTSVDPRPMGFDASLEFQPRIGDVKANRIRNRKWWHKETLRTGEPAFYKNTITDYEKLVNASLSRPSPTYPLIRSVCPSWDNSARRKEDAVILINATPEKYERWLSALAEQAQATCGQYGIDQPLVIINAWNEWAEGNHLEPCRRWRRGYLEATKRVLQRLSPGTPANAI